MEEWKVVAVGYKVSNFGNALGPRGPLTKSPSKSKGGETYYRVKINGSYVSLHRLVAENFLTKPEGKDYIDHKDKNTANNHVENLRWVSASENMLNTRNRTEHRNIYKTKSGRYSVQLRRSYDMVFSTTVDTLEEAIQIRNQKSQELDNHNPPLLPLPHPLSEDD